MITLGIDLATEPSGTAACRIDWHTLHLDVIDERLTDDALIDLIAGASMTGIDVPLGWPDPFIDAVVGHRGNQPWLHGERTRLSHRLTDHHVRATTGITPLSVSADRIGLTAMRGARLQHLLRARGVDVNRSGSSGAVVEAYPAAALRVWGFPHQRYKSKDAATARADLTELLAREAGALGPQIRGAVRTHDELDAVVCCLVARATATGATNLPTDEQLATARREGWIHVPAVSIADLLST